MSASIPAELEVQGSAGDLARAFLQRRSLLSGTGGRRGGHARARLPLPLRLLTSPARLANFSRLDTEPFRPRLNETGGDEAVRAAFQKTMRGDFDNANGAPYAPLELLMMEALPHHFAERRQHFGDHRHRASSLYGGSPFAQFGLPYERHSYMNTPHTDTSFDRGCGTSLSNSSRNAT